MGTNKLIKQPAKRKKVDSPLPLEFFQQVRHFRKRLHGFAAAVSHLPTSAKASPNHVKPKLNCNTLFNDWFVQQMKFHMEHNYSLTILCSICRNFYLHIFLNNRKFHKKHYNFFCSIDTVWQHITPKSLENFLCNGISCRFIEIYPGFGLSHLNSTVL